MEDERTWGSKLLCPGEDRRGLAHGKNLEDSRGSCQTRREEQAHRTVPCTSHRPEEGETEQATWRNIPQDPSSLTYNSNHMEGSKLTQEQTRYIYETNTIGPGDPSINVDDIVETANHFRCIDLMIDRANFTLSEAFIKQSHALLKNGTSDSRKDWFAVGEYKKLPNEVGGEETTLPEHVSQEIRSLLHAYNAIEMKTLDDIIDFHVRFETIHPFQDGNGRVGRLIMFKECLRCGIIPFIISNDMKMFYYRGLGEWHRERGFLRDTCLAAQDTFKRYLDYFRIPYNQ